MSKPLRMLVVGGGSAGVRHFRYLSEYGVQCDVCDPLADCRVSKQFPDAKRVPDYTQAELSPYDAVVICTPPIDHVPQLLQAARAGRHLLSEKPLTVLNNEGLDELQELVQKNNLVAAVAFPYATLKAMDRIIEIVQSGELGKVRSIAVHAGQDILEPRPDYFDTYYGKDELGGGTLQDDAVHPLLGLERLLGEEIEITCQRHNVGIKRPDVTADDTAWMWIRYPNEVMVTIDFSLQCHWRHNEWIINLEKGAIWVPVEEYRLEILDAATGERRSENFDDDWNETFRANDQNFVEAIYGKQAIRCDLKMAISNHRAVLAARRSAELDRLVRLEEI